jgi:hypothetical protein
VARAGVRAARLRAEKHGVAKDQFRGNRCRMQNVSMMMTMKLKFNDVATDGDFTKKMLKLLIPQAESNISSRRVSVSIKAYERVAEQQRRWEQLAEMSLGELLYYALVGEGTITDEPA